MFLFLIFISSINDDDFVITQALVDSINNDPDSTFKAKLYPKFARLTKKDFQQFLSPVRASHKTHTSARPVGFSERSFNTGDKRYFTGIYKEIICDKQDGSDPSHQRVFSEDATKVNNQYPRLQFRCDESLSSHTYSIRYYIDYADKSSIQTVGGKTVATIPLSVYDNSQYCSSWASAVTSAMTLTLSRWSHRTINLSIQFLLDCDLLGDPCMERPPLSAYEQFWRRYIPGVEEWSIRSDPLSKPSSQLTQSICENYRSCYPGLTSCRREFVLSGFCDRDMLSCPIYYLFNWRRMKSHLAEVGAITSSIIVRPAFFTYESGVYSSWNSKTKSSAWTFQAIEPPGNYLTDQRGEVMGMMDVTIIGWGQQMLNLSRYFNDQIKTAPNTWMKYRWWYVIPHLGVDFGLPCDELLKTMGEAADREDVVDSYVASGKVNEVTMKVYPFSNNDVVNHFRFRIATMYKPGTQSWDERHYCTTYDITNSKRTGIVKFNRKFDDSTIESNAVGAVPYNFVPRPWRTSPPTWKLYTVPPEVEDAFYVPI